MEVHLLEPILLLLLIACLVAIFANWIKQPYTIVLVCVGLIIALLKITPGINVSHDITMSIILPPLLFYGAMHMDLECLKENWVTIALLAIPGVLCSTFLIGFILHHLLGIEILYALLFGAIITPTDPISVLAILGKLGAPKRLKNLIEGESLFNDGTGVVVFTIILAMIAGGKDITAVDSVTKFVYIGGGGTIVGLLCGMLVYQILKHIHDHLVEVTLTVVLTFGTPLLAEHFHFSGIIAVVVAGLVIGNYGKHYSMTDRAIETLEKFWEVIDFIINSLIFIVIGVELQVIGVDALMDYSVPIALTILAVVVSRMIVVYPMMAFNNAINKEKVDLTWTHLLFWGGLKGSISLCLVVGLPVGFQYRELFLTLAFSVVLFTLIIQGLSMKPFVKSLKIS